MQIAAQEARQGHGTFAEEIRRIVDEAKANRAAIRASEGPVPIIQPRGELAALLSASFPKVRLADMILSTETFERLRRILREQRQVGRLKDHGLRARRKLLLLGPPGTGKTMSASALAGELSLPLLVIRLDGIITKFLGESAAKLRLVFDAMLQTRGVYLFDEFDSIGTQRAMPNEVGEIRRVLNAFLQFIEQDQSDSLVLAATNHPDVLDYALYRRFDDVINFSLPDAEHIRMTLQSKLSMYPEATIDWDRVTKVADGLSYADVTRACEEAVKDVIITERTSITTQTLLAAIEERRSMSAGIQRAGSS
jgi:SpoVK/Ycf46/Vps4 family AAA+-type ATPase